MITSVIQYDANHPRAQELTSIRLVAPEAVSRRAFEAVVDVVAVEAGPHAMTTEIEVEIET